MTFDQSRPETAQHLRECLSTEGQRTLAGYGFVMIPTRDMKAKCTVVVKTIGNIVAERTVEEIRHDVSKMNLVSVVDVYKLPRSGIVNIILLIR